MKNLPCPFCGTEDPHVVITGKNQFCVRCDFCLVQTTPRNNHVVVLEDWNKRKPVIEKKQYRVLEKGEIIQQGDEFDASINPMKGVPCWCQVITSMINSTAPDPQFPAHTLYRRKL